MAPPKDAVHNCCKPASTTGKIPHQYRPPCFFCRILMHDFLDSIHLHHLLHLCLAELIQFCYPELSWNPSSVSSLLCTSLTDVTLSTLSGSRFNHKLKTEFVCLLVGSLACLWMCHEPPTMNTGSNFSECFNSCLRFLLGHLLLTASIVRLSFLCNFYKRIDFKSPKYKF